MTVARPGDRGPSAPRPTPSTTCGMVPPERRWAGCSRGSVRPSSPARPPVPEAHGRVRRHAIPKMRAATGDPSGGPVRTVLSLPAVEGQLTRAGPRLPRRAWRRVRGSRHPLRDPRPSAEGMDPVEARRLSSNHFVTRRPHAARVRQHDRMGGPRRPPRGTVSDPVTGVPDAMERACRFGRRIPDVYPPCGMGGGLAAARRTAPADGECCHQNRRVVQARERRLSHVKAPTGGRRISYLVWSVRRRKSFGTR